MNEGLEMAHTAFYRHKCAIEDVFVFISSATRRKPTADIKAQHMFRGQWIKISEPQSLFVKIVEWHQKAINRYKK